MISYTQFGALRLHQFLPATEIDELDNWEFEDRLWIGEAAGFSEWLRLKTDPAVLRSLAIDFSDFPEAIAAHILELLDLAVRPGMLLTDLQALFGEPSQIYEFTPDRTTYVFRIGTTEPYSISCTVLSIGGLTYLVVMTRLPEQTHTDSAFG